MATVHDLPEDVLHIIFKLIATATDWQESRLDVTRVCKYWRAIAEECLDFWSNLNLYHCDIVPIFASRCHSGPLQAFMRADESRRKIERDNRRFGIGIIFFYSRRLTVIDVHIPYRDMTDLLHIFRNNDFLPLRDLSLLIDRDSCKADERDQLLLSDGITFFRPPLELSLRYCPNLETLHLGHVFMRRLPSETKIKDLSWANYCSDWPDHSPTPEEFLNILQDCSQLRTLHLDCAGPEQFDEPLPDGTVLKLENLLHVNLRSDNETMAQIVRYIDMPPDARISCTIADATYVYTDALPPNMVNFGFQVPEPLTIELTIHNDDLSPTDLTLGVSRRSEIEAASHLGIAKGKLEQRFQLNWQHALAVPAGCPRLHIVPMLAWIGRQIEARTGCNVEGIYIRCDLGLLNWVCWVRILNEYSDVKKLRLVHLGPTDAECIRWFFHVLRPAGAQHFRCPELETIELYGVGVTPGCVKIASDVLKYRQGAGFQLHELVIAHRPGEEANWNTFDKSTVSHLNTLVVEDM